MSSLAASRADNFYFPPEWEPSMGSISKYQGSKGKNQYEQHGIIRFELPFDAWCLKCNLHMSKGLRFNAKKEKSSNYFTTTIWSFITKCYDCNQQFIIKTNPKDNTYDFEEGLRKHEQEYDIGAEEGVVELTTTEKRTQLDQDPMFRLQHNEADKSRTKSIKQNLSNLQRVQEAQQRNDYDMNALLRQKNRSLKKKECKMLKEGHNKGLSIPLLEATDKDRQVAGAVNFRLKRKDSSKSIERQKLLQVQTQSIFDRSNKKSSLSLQAIQHLVDTKVQISNFQLASGSPSKPFEELNSHIIKKRRTAESNMEQQRSGTYNDHCDHHDNVLSLLAEY